MSLVRSMVLLPPVGLVVLVVVEVVVVVMLNLVQCLSRAMATEMLAILSLVSPLCAHLVSTLANLSSGTP